MKILFGKDPARNIARFGGQFFTWWIQELVSLVPTRWRRKERARIEARQDTEGFILTAIRPPNVAREGRLYQGRIEPAGFSDDSPIRQNRLLVWLVPSEESILSRRVQVPASAAPKFENVLRFEIDRWSPYKLDEVYVTWDELTPEDAARRVIDLRLIPRSLVEGWRAELTAVGLSPSWLALGSGKRHLINLRPSSGRAIRARAISVFASIIFGTAAIAADWYVAASELDAWRERYRAEVRLLTLQRNLEDRISRTVLSVEQTSSALSKGRTLAALSAALPETDWLTEIVIKNQGLTLRGYTANLDQLIKALAPLAADRNINLQGEVAFDSSTNRHRFTVAFRPEGA